MRNLDETNAAAERLQDVGRSVGRSVVDDDDFPAHKSLRKRRRHRLADEISLVEAGDDDAKTWHCLNPGFLALALALGLVNEATDDEPCPRPRRPLNTQ